MSDTAPKVTPPAAGSEREKETEPPAPEPTLPSPPPLEDFPVVPGYVIFKKLDTGGMGVVYLAEQLNLRRRTVALKMIRRPSPDPQELGRFRIEAKGVASLNHPNVVQIYEYGVADGRPYFVMEYVAGGSLADRLARGPLAPHDAAVLMETLARAMDYVHGCGIVHRDLKPSNVLLTSDGAVKVADFGLAKLLDSGTAPTLPVVSVTGMVMGTPSYMSPEQAGGRVRDVGPPSDVYSLGAILYELLIGRPPFLGDTREAIYYQVMHDEPVPPSHLRPELPRELEAVCLKCLEKKPEDRYGSALALADDLRRFLDGEPVSAGPFDEWAWRERWARRAGFEILDVLTCGVRDVVYLAREVSFDKLVALKVLTAVGPLDPADVERFRSEAQAMDRLDHVNIVRSRRFGELNGRPFFVTEYLDGGSLTEHYLDRPAPPREAAAVVAALAGAIQHAHEQGVLHCALRPSNVLRTRDGTPKVTNFNLAVLREKEPEEQHRAKAFRRLASYAAPELAQGRLEEVGPAADVYALGAILYKLLTGGPPFLADTVEGTLEQVCTQPPAAPASLQPDVPIDLEAICLQCLEKVPARRPASAGELKAALRRFLARRETDTTEFELIPGYEIFEELGRGGLGVVHRARHVAFNRAVALKIFHPLGPQRTARILAVTRVAERLHHPNILRVYDCGERDHRLYVAEELVEGPSLAETIARGMPAPAAARIVETVARAVHHAHECGIVHSNLKPRVVLLTREGQPKISSFEMARLLGEHTGATEVQPGTFVGTPLYVAPEQLEGSAERICPATDVYALGAILYECLTGRPPFPKAIITDVLAAVRTRRPEPPRSLRPDTPRALEAICLRCLQKEPSRRYSSAGAMAVALARSHSALGRLVSWLRKG